MKKRMVSLILGVVMLLSFIPVISYAETNGKCGDNLTWSYNDGTLTITGNGDIYDYGWDDTIQEWTDAPWYQYASQVNNIIFDGVITAIGNSAFRNFSNIKSVNLPFSVTKIGEDAFAYCEKLQYIYVQDNIQYVGSNAFYETAWLNDNSDKVIYIGHVLYKYINNDNIKEDVAIKDGTIGIAESAFADCSGPENITIPSSVKFIGEYAFSNCFGLTNINVDKNNNHYHSIDGMLIQSNDATLIAVGEGKSGQLIIPDGVKKLGKHALPFYNLGITSISIPASLTDLDVDNIERPEDVLFLGFENLADIKVDPKNPAYCSDNNVIFDKSKKTLIRCPEGKTGDVPIPDTVNNVAAYAFAYCKKVNSVNVPNTVNDLGEYTFCRCEKITQINIPSKLNDIPDGLLEGCVSLKNILLPNGIKTIGNYAFSDCESLEKLDLPTGIKSIGDSAFYNCSSFKELVIPEGVTSIGYYACCGCSSLEKITMPKSLTRIGGKQFGSCDNLKYISYCGTMRDWERLYENGEGQYSLPEGCVVQCSDGSFYEDYAPITNIAIISLTNTVFTDQKIKLTAVCTPYNASYKRVTWSSSNNAVAAVNQNGYVTGKSAGTATITAACSNGLTASYEVTVKVRGISGDSSEDIYSYYTYNFPNEKSSFGYSSDYKIPVERYLQAGVPLAVALYRNRKNWGGNCFGMSASSVLFFKDILQAKNYSSMRYPINFSAPSSNSEQDTKLREMIELFQVSQSLVLYSYENLSLKDNAWNMAAELDNGNPILLSLEAKNSDNKSVGHCVVIYGYTHNYNTIDFKIYDCSGFVTDLYMQDNKCWFTYKNKKYIWHPSSYCRFGSVYSVYKAMKAYNNFISLFSAEQQPYIYISHPIEDMTITNSAGQTALITDGEVSGDIEDISVIPDSYLSEDPNYTIILPEDEYTITGSSDNWVTTSAANDNMSVNVSGISSTPIKISADLKSISLQNDSESDYSIEYTTYDNIFDKMTLSITAEGSLGTVLDNSDIIISGAKSIYATATVSGQDTDVYADIITSDEAVVSVNNDRTVQMLVDNEAVTTEELPERQQTYTPYYDLESGEYSKGQTLTFTKDDDALIYYTTDGTEPNENGILYTAPIEINKTTTIKAIAKKYGYTDSDILTLEYTLPSVDAPVSALESGTYDEIQSVSLSSEDEATIYYTTDGGNPLEEGVEYTVDISIYEDTVLKAVAVKNGCVSDIATFEYTIENKHPLAVINTPTDENGNIITSNTIGDITKINLVLQKFDENEVGGDFIVACYDSSKRLLGVSINRQLCDKEINTLELSVPEYDNISNIKVFGWNSLKGMKPLFDAEDI